MFLTMCVDRAELREIKKRETVRLRKQCSKHSNALKIKGVAFRTTPFKAFMLCLRERQITGSLCY